MVMNRYLSSILVLLGIVMSSFNTEQSSDAMAHIELTITDIRGEEGIIGLGVFDTEDGFDKEIAYKSFHFDKSNLKDGQMTVTFDLKPDTYGISLLDDENGNDQMDYNLLGIPKEGFGFADYYHSGFSKPSFATFKFVIKAGETKKLQAKFRYIL